MNNNSIGSLAPGAPTGIGCERCHTGALEHQTAALHGSREHMPPDLSQSPPSELNETCGQCHRTWEAVVRGNKTGSIDNVRMQPYRLTNSQCFDGLDKRLSCVTCHDPHQPQITSVSAVDKTCLSCHATGTRATAVEHEHPKICPVGTHDCATCHMPKVQLLGGDIAFTDHQIRVVHPGDKYPN